MHASPRLAWLVGVCTLRMGTQERRRSNTRNVLYTPHQSAGVASRAHLVVEGQDLSAHVRPGHAGQATHQPAGGEPAPAAKHPPHPATSAQSFVSAVSATEDVTIPTASGSASGVGGHTTEAQPVRIHNQPRGRKGLARMCAQHVSNVSQHPMCTQWAVLDIAAQ